MRRIRKIFFISLWIVIGSGTLVLLVAAIRSRNDKICKGIAIEVNGSASGKWLLSRNDIINQLTGNGSEKIKGRVLATFDLRILEEKLEKHVWIRDAELFFDNNELLQVRLTERVPVARIFTTKGGSFYIDNTGRRLPLSDRLTLKLPLFTGFPTDKNTLSAGDSLLLNEVLDIGRYLAKDSFWNSQVAQVDITPARTFELVPTVGNHIIEFGNGANAETKFSKMLIFYRQVLRNTGLDRYERINVQYDQQVIGVKKARYITKADSLQAVKNIRVLIESAQDMQQAVADSFSVQNPLPPIKTKNNSDDHTNQTPGKNQTIQAQPKAVMPARN